MVDPLIQGILEAHGAPKTRIGEPPSGTDVWYRGWECGWDATAASYGAEGWRAYKGGCDLDAPQAGGRTWAELLDDIDDAEDEARPDCKKHGSPFISPGICPFCVDEQSVTDADDFECADCPMASPADCMLASYCPHRDGPQGGEA